MFSCVWWYLKKHFVLWDEILIFQHAFLIDMTLMTGFSLDWNLKLLFYHHRRRSVLFSTLRCFDALLQMLFWKVLSLVQQFQTWGPCPSTGTPDSSQGPFCSVLLFCLLNFIPTKASPFTTICVPSCCRWCKAAHPLEGTAKSLVQSSDLNVSQFCGNSFL